MNIAVDVFDEGRKGKDIAMGTASFNINELLGVKGSTMAVKMKKGGKVIARVEKLKGTGTLRLKLSGSKLKDIESGLFNKSDPFFQIMRKHYGKGGFEWHAVHKSDVVKDNLNPTWREHTIPLNTLCGGDLDAPLLLTVSDYESDGKHDQMGQVEITVNKLVNTVGQVGLYMIDKKGKNVGTIIVNTAEISGIETVHNENDSSIESKMNDMSATPHEPQTTEASAKAPGTPKVASPSTPVIYTPSSTSFVDYISGGCEIKLCVAIDFTGSNGDPRERGTLHYINPNEKNDYEKAITAVGGVLANYDTDGKVPVRGFGAKFDGQINHLFQCGETPEVDGVSGIIDAYHNTFKSRLVMSKPTVVTQVIDTAASFARKEQEDARKEGKMKYSVLLILTDGKVSDMKATIASLRAASDSPLSIVVVGVGNADFSAMRYLDDKGSETDILKFVEFNTHKHDATSLTEAALNEIPDQLVGYFQRNGIRPPPSIQVEE